MDVLFQTTYSNVFHSSETVHFNSNVTEVCSQESHWHDSIGSGDGLARNRRQAITTGDPLHSRAACTQPCNVNTHSRAHCSPGARLCEQWGRGCVNNGARLCASARLCRGSPVITWPNLRAHVYVTLSQRVNKIYLCTWTFSIPYVSNNWEDHYTNALWVAVRHFNQPVYYSEFTPHKGLEGLCFKGYSR